MSDREFLVQISDPEDLRITVCVPAEYSPDVLTDAKNRALDLYKETLAFRQAIGRQNAQNVYADLERILAEGDDEDYDDEEGDEDE